MKVSPQQSRGVKCLSCLFTVNDGFDSSPKEQWEMGSEGHALGVDGEGGGGCRRFVMMRSVLPIEWEFSCRCVYTCFWRQLKAYGQPSQTPPPHHSPIPSQHTAQAQRVLLVAAAVSCNCGLAAHLSPR